MGTMRGYLVVFLGAGFGATMRHAINRGSLALGTTFPWGTMLVNISGSLAMGLIAGWFAFRGESNQTTRLFLTTGVLGGYTTFSAFALDVALVWERGEVAAAAGYVIASVAGSLIGVFVGLSLMRQ